MLQMKDGAERAGMRYDKGRDLWLRKDGSNIGGIVHLSMEQLLDLRPSVRTRMLRQPHLTLTGVPAMDGAFYWDTRMPFIAADITSVTLAATDKALYPASNFPVLGGQYWALIGKRVRIKLFGRITTAATPGNGAWDIYYGSGADATGTIIVSSAAVALTANQTNLSWQMECTIHARSLGSAGTLFGTGIAFFNEAVLASKVLIPASAPAVSSGVDLTAANLISVQYKRSGSTAETMQVHDLEVVAMN
jgi:hypothetical protein